jgi:TM2 domain-containing membrane protein YozV
MAFCRTCGRIVGQGAVACPGCGHAPAAGTGFCNHCGAATQPGQIACLSCGYALGTLAGSSAKNKVTAGLLGIFLGALGIHKFYLGYPKAGAIMLVVCLVGGFFFGLGTLAAAIVGLIEGIMYLSKSDAEFAATYVTGKKEWF